MAKKRRHTYFIRFPSTSHRKRMPLQERLLWWNTHYKSRHVWTGGRIEVVFEKALKGYNQIGEEDDSSSSSEEGQERPRPYVSFPCPHCRKAIWYWVDYIDAHKGDLKCWGCGKPFGVHPSGQIFVVRDLHKEVDESKVDKEYLEKWLKQNCHYLDVFVHPHRKGDEGLEVDIEWVGDDDAANPKASGLREFRRLLTNSGFTYQRVG